MSLYLSRLMLDVRSRRVDAELAHPYEMHRTLMRAFPKVVGGSGQPREEFGVLFRPDVDQSGGVVNVYVQSYVRPDWSFLDGIGQYVTPGAPTLAYECKDVEHVLRKIEDGQTFAFRLRANPTKRVGRDDDPLKGKRVELQQEDEQIAWLADKGRGGREGVPGGFELLTSRLSDGEGGEMLVPHVRVCREGKFIGLKGGSTNARKTTHLSVIFDGLLRVTEAGAFFDTVRLGIGGGKAYGFGLLSLAPSSAHRLGGIS